MDLAFSQHCCNARQLFTAESNETSVGLSSFEWLDGLMHSQHQQSEWVSMLLMATSQLNTINVFWLKIHVVSAGFLRLAVKTHSLQCNFISVFTKNPTMTLSINQSIKSSICKSPHKQSSQRRLLWVGLHKEPRLKARLQLFATNTTVLEMRW